MAGCLGTLMGTGTCRRSLQCGVLGSAGLVATVANVYKLWVRRRNVRLLLLLLMLMMRLPIEIESVVLLDDGVTGRRRCKHELFGGCPGPGAVRDRNSGDRRCCRLYV